MISLVQATKSPQQVCKFCKQNSLQSSTMGSIDSVNPTKHDGKIIYLQDVENRREAKPADFPKFGGMNVLKAKIEGNEKIPDKSWWEITIHVEEVSSALRDDDSIYNEKETYVLGYSPS